MSIKLDNKENEEADKDGFEITFINGIDINSKLSKVLSRDTFLVVFVKSGSITIEIQDTIYVVEAKDIVVLAENAMFFHRAYNQKLKLYIITLTTQFAFDLFLNKEIMNLFLIVLNREYRKLSLSKDQFIVFSLICRLLHVLRKKYLTSDNGKKLFKLGVNLFFYELTFLYTSSSIDIDGKDTRKSNLTVQFLSLLIENGVKQHKVKFYADTLCVTCDYLSKVVKQKTGKTIKSLIAEVIMVEAKKLLSDLELSIKEISQILEFSNISNFSSFFKHHTLISPSEFRARKASSRKK